MKLHEIIYRTLQEMLLVDIYIKTIERHKEKDTFNLTELRKAFGDINHRIHMGMVGAHFKFVWIYTSNSLYKCIHNTNHE